MKRSEAIKKIQDIIEKLGEESDAGNLLGDLDPGEAFLEELLQNGFPIPCNKKGKFDWDKEDENESI